MGEEIRKLTEFDDRVLDSIRDENLHTYASISQDIGADSGDVYASLERMVRGGVLVRGEGRPIPYYFPGTEPEPGDLYASIIESANEPVTGPHSQTASKRYSAAQRKVKIDRIADIIADGGTWQTLADEFGVHCTTLRRYADTDDEFGKSIMDAFWEGKKRWADQPIAQEQTDEPGHQNGGSAGVQEPAARVVATEPAAPTESVYLRKAVESSNSTENDNDIAPIVPELLVDAGSGESYNEAIIVEFEKETSAEKCGVERSPAQSLIGQIADQHGSTSHHLVSHHVELANGGLIYIGIYCDLFRASAVERDLIEGIIQLVQQYKITTNKVEVPA